MRRDLRSAVQFGLFVQDVLLDQFFLFLRKHEVGHFLLKHFPGITPLLFVCAPFVVLALDVALGDLSTFLHRLGHLLLRLCSLVALLYHDLGLRLHYLVLRGNLSERVLVCRLGFDEEVLLALLS